jgi:hypothetical protein
MVGVANPMLRHRRSEAFRFLLGLTVGMVLASLALAFVAWVLGSSLATLVPSHVRLLLLAALCALFGAADLLNRTPHVRRQVPQALVRALPPGQVALAWGFDLGLLFTTQKVVSLLWAALAAVVLVAPDAGPAILGTVAILSSLTIAGGTLGGWRGVGNFGTSRSRAWTRQVKALSGAALIATGTVILWQAFQV